MEYTVSPEEIKRVKGMGFLQDKRYPDVFNARVITKNGKITAQQHRVIAEASEKIRLGRRHDDGAADAGDPGDQV